MSSDLSYVSKLIYMQAQSLLALVSVADFFLGNMINKYIKIK